jgi:hypothetical protein
MCREAESRNKDADLLESNISTASDSGYLLRLLAFELSLKCVLVINGIEPRSSHDYCSLMGKMPEEICDKVFKVAVERMAGHADYSDRTKLLKKYEENFIALRYPYEKYENMTEEEYLQYGNLWVEIGSPVEEGEFIYYPSELDGLVYALLKEANKWLGDNSK